MKNYKSNNNVVYSCKYHVVWCPKYRRKVLVGSIETRLKELIQETCSTINVEIIEMELMPDHVHLLMEVDPQFGIHKAVKQIKGRTSRILRQEFPDSVKTADPLDEFLFCFHDWRCPVGSHQTIHRKSKDTWRK